MDLSDLPFEYTTRYGDHFKDWGIPLDQAAALEERDRELEDYLAGLSTGAASSIPAFMFGKPLLVGASSGRWYATADVSYSGVFASLGTAGTSTTTAVLKKNGTTVATLSFASGANTDDETVAISLTAKTDYLTAEITDAGTGALDLTIQPY